MRYLSRFFSRRSRVSNFNARTRHRRIFLEQLESRDLLSQWTVNVDSGSGYVLEGSVDATISFNRECESCDGSEPPDSEPTFTIDYIVEPDPTDTSPASASDFGVPNPIPFGRSANDYVISSGTVYFGPGETSKSLYFHAFDSDGVEGYWLNGEFVPQEYAHIQITSVTSDPEIDRIDYSSVLVLCQGQKFGLS